MRTSARSGMALAMAGAAGGLTLLTGGAVAQAAPIAQEATTAQQAIAATCRYEVTARNGLAVRSGPSTKSRQVGTLKFRTHISADCKNSGFTQLRGGVPSNLIGKWVSRSFLKPIQPAKTCRYEVTARNGLAVRSGPSTKFRQVGTLKFRTHISADCKNSGFTQLRGGVPSNLIGKWVSRSFLKPIQPSGGVGTGGGGTSAETSPLLAGAGLGAIAMGGGMVLMARRRQTAKDAS